MAAVQSLTQDVPQITASATLSVASADVAAPTNAEYVRVAASVVCNFRYGIGAQTAVATDQLLSPGESLVIRLGTSAQAYHFAAIAAGAGQLTVTRCAP